MNFTIFLIYCVISGGIFGYISAKYSNSIVFCYFMILLFSVFNGLVAFTLTTFGVF